MITVLSVGTHWLSNILLLLKHSVSGIWIHLCSTYAALISAAFQGQRAKHPRLSWCGCVENKLRASFLQFVLQIVLHAAVWLLNPCNVHEAFRKLSWCCCKRRINSQHSLSLYYMLLYNIILCWASKMAPLQYSWDQFRSVHQCWISLLIAHRKYCTGCFFSLGLPLKS